LRLRRTLLGLGGLGFALIQATSAHGAAAIHLPFPAGTSISIIQGYNGGTHQGVERYSLDLVRDDGKTSGSAALAPAAGTVVWAYAPGANNGCIGIQVDGGGGLHEMLCHLLLDRAYNNGEHVATGQILGTVGRPGTVGNNGTAHIHLQLYRVIAGERTPVPFAQPDGEPLEGVSLPKGSGSANQWSCNGGQGPGCHMQSANSSAASPLTAAPNNTITAAASASTSGATLSTPRQANSSLSVGTAVTVTGTGDCLRVHDRATTASNTVTCLPDGTQSVVTDGPTVADGYTWYKLGDLGWSVSDYLTPANSGSSVPPPATVPVPAPAAAPPPSTPAPTPTPQPAQPSPATALPVLPVGVSFAVGDPVAVAGAGDCLNVHEGPSTSGAVLDCIADGTPGIISDGPVRADGYIWYRLDARGWVVSDFLKRQ